MELSRILELTVNQPQGLDLFINLEDLGGAEVSMSLLLLERERGSGNVSKLD